MTKSRCCPVCGHAQGELLFHPNKSPGPVSKCKQCNMVYISEIEDVHAIFFDGPVLFEQMDSKILTSSNIDDVKDSWEFQMLPDKVSEWPALRENAIEILQKIKFHLKEPINGCKIFDFGSGWGFFLAVAKEFGLKPYGMEPLPASSVYARAKFNLEIITDTLRENSFPKDFFDVITALQVFEHLPYPNENIKCLSGMLRCNGIILIEVPYYDTWMVRCMKSRHRHFVEDHLNFFTKHSLKQLLENNGFEIIEYYFPTRRMSIRHLIYRWLPKVLPSSIARVIQNLFKRTIMIDHIFGINLGDIITVIARKIE